MNVEQPDADTRALAGDAPDKEDVEAHADAQRLEAFAWRLGWKEGCPEEFLRGYEESLRQAAARPLPPIKENQRQKEDHAGVRGQKVPYDAAATRAVGHSMSGGAVQGDSRRSRGSRRVKDPPAPAGVVIAELPPPPESQRQGKKDHAEAEGHVVLPPPPESQRQGK